ncbi:hypothetical protein HNP52_002305 [Sphingomonas kyeonggiensis]|uniref:Spore coat protein U domain-containing protein n=1 Tax=Sphingomonas kyeonggiensis TaxID=1268553 RepID=A0A7W7NSX1_9SPHN|nr:hypothetical protein [Sphingomonas kyeonggiensis]MBB4839236.1 hypothetical protein [Sphingomonas kyeonggiensis]
MKRILIPVALAMLPAAALAQNQPQPVTGHLDIIGEAPAACLMKSPAGTSGTNASFDPVSSGTGRIRIDQLASLNDATPLAAAIRVELPVICNAPHRIVLRSGNGGLRRDGAAVASVAPFRQLLPYRLGVRWGADQAERGTDDGTPITIDASSARSGDLAVLFTLASGGAPLVAGNYTDEIVLEIQVAD